MFLASVSYMCDLAPFQGASPGWAGSQSWNPGLNPLAPPASGATNRNRNARSVRCLVHEPDRRQTTRRIIEPAVTWKSGSRISRCFCKFFLKPRLRRTSSRELSYMNPPSNDDSRTNQETQAFDPPLIHEEEMAHPAPEDD